MYKLGSKSQSILNTCDARLKEVLHEAIKYIDFSVVSGYRGQKEQEDLMREGKSKLQFPKSKHNQLPSKAVDVAPYPIDWQNKSRFYFLAGIIMGIASTKNIPLRFGGDWDRDGEIADNKFDDLLHFEIHEESE